MEIIEVTALIAAISTLVAATAALIREVRQWRAAKKEGKRSW